MIEVQNLSKSFRVHRKAPGFWGSFRSLFNRQWTDKHALKSVSFKIEAGEIVGLIGANGAGKTTLVKILSGIIHPSGGEASVLGFKPWEREDDFRRQISLIMGQKAQLWWDLPAEDSFELLREIYEIERPEYKRTLEYLVETMGVKDQLNVQVRRLSLGERMKMELIAALLHKPKVVFLDEPTIGLDITAQRAVRKFIKEYREANKPAMILTSHYMEDIEKLCKRIVIIKDGEFVYDGSLEKVRGQIAGHRVIAVTLGEGFDAAKLDLLGAERLPGELPLVRYKVAEKNVAKTVTQAVTSLPVVDIRVEEEDIANVIEVIMRKGRA